jgi:uncharacterized protein DUF5666
MKRTLVVNFIVLAVAFVCAQVASGVGTGGTGVYVRGALGVGPGVVVSNITFDASQAAITINGRAGRPVDDLRPGMVAGVAGNVVPGQQAGVASQVGVTRSVYGGVMKVGTGGTGLKVAGVSVAPRTDTVYGGLASVGDIEQGDTLDVYGYSDGVSGTVYATRIERVPAASGVELHGIVATPGPTGFVLQGVAVDYSAAQLVGFSAPLAAGDRVGVAGTLDPQNVLIASTVTFEPDTHTSNGQEVEIEDAITVVLAPGLFIVDDFMVDATKATFGGGSAADLAVGRVVHVEGRMENGTLMARDVEFDDEEESRSYVGGSEVDGTIASVAPPTSFVVKGVTVDASAATFANGQAGDVVVGRFVKVIGSRNGATMRATKVTFANGGGSWSSFGEVEGRVSAVSSPGVYAIGSITVDARAATISGGTLASISVGSKIEARGAWQGGVLMAKKVEIDH